MMYKYIYTMYLNNYDMRHIKKITTLSQCKLSIITQLTNQNTNT